MSTILEYAGARLANAVANWIHYPDDPMARTGLKLALSEYREAERRHAAAVAANDLQDGDQ